SSAAPGSGVAGVRRAPPPSRLRGRLKTLRGASDTVTRMPSEAWRAANGARSRVLRAPPSAGAADATPSPCGLPIFDGKRRAGCLDSGPWSEARARLARTLLEGTGDRAKPWAAARTLLLPDVGTLRDFRRGFPRRRGWHRSAGSFPSRACVGLALPVR